ncbi:MAG: hypothetical protein HY805_01135 [Nitrospirae bacterium]|nr:hypothetical protein [Nitrospirota bacterium]
MRKRLNLTIDEAVYEEIGRLPMPRNISISECVTWILRMMAKDLKPNAMSDNEFIKMMDSDPRGKEVRKFLQEKLGPVFYPIMDTVEFAKRKIKMTPKRDKGKK